MIGSEAGALLARKMAISHPTPRFESRELFPDISDGYHHDERLSRAVDCRI
jgi:hypothetical protein